MPSHEEYVANSENQNLGGQDEAIRILLNAPLDTIALIDTQGRFLNINESGAKRLNSTVEELQGVCAFDLFPQDIAEVRREKLQEVIESRRPVTFDDFRNGMYLANSMYPVFGEDGGVIAVAVFAKDITERTQAANQTEDLRDFYELVLKNVQDGIWVTDENDRMTYFNPGMERIAGVKAEDVLGMSVVEDFPPETTAHFLSFYHKARREGRSQEYEAEVVMPSGRPTVQAGWLTPRMDGGKYRGMIWTIQDITERKKAVKALRESEVQKDLILNSTREFIIYYSPDLDVIWANKTAVHSVPGGEDAIVRRKCYKVWHQRDSACPNCPIVRARDTGEPAKGEVTTPDGRSWLIRGYPVRNDAGEIVGMVEFGSDITHKEVAKRQILLEQQKTQQYLEVAEILLIAIDKSGTVTTINPKGCEILGLAENEIVGTNWFDRFLPKDTIKEIRSVFAKIMSGDLDPVKHYTNPIVRPDGTLRQISWHNSVLHDDDGKIIGLFSSGEDVTERLEAEEATRKSEREFRALFENSPDIIALVNLDGTIRDINRVSPGYQKEQVVGKPLYNVLTSDQMDDYESAVKRSLETGRQQSYEVELDGPQGEKGYWLNRVSPIIVDGEPTAIVVNCTEVTQQEKAKRELQESEEKYRLLVENQTDLIVHVDTSGRFQFVSPSYCKTFGKSEDELLGKTFMPLVHEDDREATSEAMEDVVRPPFTATIEQRTMTADGWRWFSWVDTAVLNDQGEVVGIVGVGRDITDRKEAEEKFRSSQERFQAVFDQVYDGILVANATTRRLTMSNNRIREMLGYTEEELLGMTVADIHPEESLPTVADAFRRQLKREIRIAPELPLKRKDGSILYADISSTPIVMDGDRCLLGAFHDVTERRKALAEREKLQSQLQQSQKMESIGRLAGGVAHDINNMLTTITGFTELAMSSMDSSSSTYQDLSQVLESAERSANIVTQLLAFARKQAVEPKVLNLNDGIESMMKMLRRLIGEHIELVWKPSPSLWPVKIDPGQADQMIANLCVNARDAIGGAGTIVVETRNVVLNEEFCSDHIDLTPGEYVLVEVSDDGAGMDEETLKNVFEPFYTTKETGQGTGLGLSMVYGSVTHAGGHIDASSVPSEGSTFRVFLPRVLEEEGISRPNVIGTTETAGSGEVVLIVEDEASVLKVAELALQRNGYTTLTANGPDEALKLSAIHEGQIDLLITDMVMPNMTGRSLAEHILKSRPGIKVLFMSGYSVDVIPGQSIEGTVAGFIQKPFTAGKLAAKARETLLASG